MSAVALSLAWLCVHVCRTNVLRCCVSSSNGWVLLLLKLGALSHFSFHLIACPHSPGWNSLLLSLLSESCPRCSTPPNEGRPCFSSVFFSACPCPLQPCFHISDGERALLQVPLLKGVTACVASATGTIETNS